MRGRVFRGLLTADLSPSTVDGPGGLRGHVVLLGAFGVDGANLPLRAQRLVAYLGIHRRRQARDRLAEWLWPNRTPESARLNLRQAVFQERRASHGLVQSSREELWLTPSVTVDLHEVIADVHQLLASPAVIALEFDQSRLVHDLLPGWHDEWLETERERFRELRLHGLEALGEFWLAVGRWARAVEAALTAVAVDPLRESVHALLIRAYMAEHNLPQALDVYGSYRDLLRREVGCDPSTELLQLLSR